MPLLQTRRKLSITHKNWEMMYVSWISGWCWKQCCVLPGAWFEGEPQPEPCNPLRCWSLLYLLKNISLNTLSRLVRPFHLASVMLTGRCCQCEDIRKLLTWMSIQLQVYLIKGTFADLWVSTVCQSFGSNKALLLQQAQLVSHEFKELLP